MLHLDWNLVFTIINLIVLYLLMKKFLIGPVMGVIQKRESLVSSQLSSAKESETKAAELKSQYEAALKSAKEESNKIVEQAKNEARLQADRIVADANTQAAEIMTKAQNSIQAETEAAMQRMQNQVAEVAMQAAFKIMGEKSSSEKDASLYDQFLEKAGDSHVRSDN